MQAEEWIRLLIAAGAHFAAAIIPWDEIPHCHYISPYPELVPSFLVRARLRCGRMLQHVAQRLQAAFSGARFEPRWSTARMEIGSSHNHILLMSNMDTRASDTTPGALFPDP
jgi:hypothetical protein